MTFDPTTASPEFDPTTAAPDDGGPDLRTILKQALPVSPDDAASVVRLGKRYPTPAEVMLRNLPTMQQREALDNAEEILRANPKLADYLHTNPWATKQSHDDLTTLSKVGDFMGKLGSSMKAGVYSANRGAAGVLRAAAEFVAPLADVLEVDPTKAENVGDWRAAIGGNPLRRLAEGLNMDADASGQAAAAVRPKGDGVLESGVFSGMESLSQNLMTLPAALLNPAAGLSMMGGFTGGNAYEDARDKGLPMSQALPFAASQAAIEVATEKLPLGKLLGDLKAGTAAWKMVLNQIAREVPGEQAATILQDLNEWAVLNPEKPFSDYLTERPNAAAQTLIATIVGAGGNVAVVKAIEAAVNTAVRDGADMQRAGAFSQALEQTFKAAEASALRERNPEEFRSMMAAMSDNGTVYVDAEILNQMPASVLQHMEGVATELPAALATNSSVGVKLADAMTLLAGTPQAELFMQHARVSPEAPSAFEAEQAGKTAGEFLKREAERVMAQAQDQEAMRASSDAVKQTLLDQLNATARHSPAVNEGLATWAGAFYTTMAARNGMTPEAFYAAYPLRILAEPSTQEPVMDQPRTGAMTVEGYHFSKSERPVISTHAFGTGLQGSERETYLNANDKRLRKRSSFYVDKGTGINPEAGVGGIGHRVSLANVYDSDADPLRLRKGGQLAFESAVLDNGFSGYLTRMDGSQSGQVVMLGDQTFKPEILGPTQTTKGRVVPPPAARESLGRDKIVDALQADKALPSGSPTLARWQEILARNPEVLQALQEAGVFDGDQTENVYKSELIKRFENATEAPVYNQSLSSRLPGGKKATEDPLDTTTVISWDVTMSDPVTLEKNVEALKAYPNMRKLKGKGAKDPVRNAETFIDHVVNNLLWLHDHMPVEMRDRARLWYDGGRKTVEVWADRYGISEMQGAAAIAVLSPQNGWFANVSQAERIADMVFGLREYVWDDAMTAEATRISGEDGLDEKMQAAIGKSLGELLATPDVAARWARVYDQTHNNRAYRVLTPEGGAADYVQTNAGNDATMMWKSYSTIAKAISVLTDGRAENVHYQIGKEHKVRNFYNNIFDPKSANGYATIDTHAVAAALLRPLASADTEVLQAFGGTGSASSLKTGLNGTYPIYLEAYRRAAEARGLQAREMQSITWEAVRGLFEAAKKSGMKKGANEIWTRYQSGEIDQAQAQQEILKLAGDITPPSWTEVPYNDTPARTYEGPAQKAIDALAPAGKTTSTTSVMFEVAPDPNDAALTAEWNSLSPEERLVISQQVAARVVPQVLRELGTDGDFVMQLGGYQGATNPSMTLRVARPELALTAAKMLGHALSQDSMMLVSDQQLVGTDEVGAVTITLPEGYGESEIAALYDKLWELEHGGEKLVGGHTTADGRMAILNYSPLSNEDLAAMIDTHLGGQFEIATNTVYSAFPTKEDYGYAGDQSPEGDAAPRQAPAQRRPDRLRSEATGYLREALDARRAQAEVLNQAPTRSDKLTAWFGSDSTMVNPDGTPRVLFHGTTKKGARGVKAGQFKRSTHGAMGPAVYLGDDAEASAGYDDGAMLQVYARGKYLTNAQWTEYVNAHGWKGAETAARADGWAGVYDTEFENAVAVWNPDNIKSVDAKQFKDDGQFLSQKQATTPRGTFNPKTLELVLNPNANLSTFFHETGHFFLEVMADLASQPNAPAQIADDMAKILSWGGVPDLATWNSYSLEQKRALHERWAESIEQYVMEGKAPSIELQGPMRRFAAWLKSVYKSIKQFLAQHGQMPVAGGKTLNQAADVTQTPEFKAWFGSSMARERMVSSKQRFEDMPPLRMFHTTRDASFDKFEANRATINSTTFGDVETSRAASFFTPSIEDSNAYGQLSDGRVVKGAATMPVYLRATNPLWLDEGISEEDAQRLIDAGMSARFVYNALGHWSMFDDAEGKDTVELIKKAGFDSVVFNDQNPVTGDTFEAWAVFNPEQIKSAIGNDGTFDANDPSILSQGNQPNPSNIQLNDDIRRVMDRMLATDEQIAQANQAAGMAPNEDADAEAAERLNKRSMADLKWAVRARDQVIAKLRKQAKSLEAGIREEATVEVDQTPEMRAKRALDALAVVPEYAAQLAEHKRLRKEAETAVQAEVKAALLADNPDAKGLVKGQLLAKNKRDLANKVEQRMIRWDHENPAPKRPVNADDADVATIADSFGFETVDKMMQAIDAYGQRQDAIDSITQRRMLEEHGDLVDEDAIKQAANEAVHNEARARSLATELRTQREMLNPRQDTGEVNAKGSKITVNALVEAAKQFGAQVVGRTTLTDLKNKAWQHTAAERRAAKAWAEATAAGKTEEAVKAKQDQLLNNAAAKAALDAKVEAQKILDFFKRVTKGNSEDVVDKGRDADVVNAARAVLAAYGVQTPTTKKAADYLDTLAKHDPEAYNVIKPMVDGALQNAQPLDALTVEQLRALNEEIGAMWFLAKRMRQMEVGGNLMDIQDAADELHARMVDIGIPDTIPGEEGAVTKAEERARWLQFARALLSRVEQWTERMDGKWGGPFSRYVFQPIKQAADAYRTDRSIYRKKFQALVDNIAPSMRHELIEAPELNYTFGRGHNGIGTAELLHAVLHTGNESNKRKLLLGRQWATENADGTLDTSKWDTFITRMINTGVLGKEHYDFAQGVWDLLEQTKPLAQKAHRDVFGRYFDEVTADAFVTPFGTYRGGYVPAQADPAIVSDADLRALAEMENENMAFSFPTTSKGFTKSRVEYNRPLRLDLRTIPQHLDKVLLFAHMEPAVRGVAKLLRQKGVSQAMNRIDPAAYSGMLLPWLNRSARQQVETPVLGDGRVSRVLSALRSRAGAAVMFANVSNAVQQITGFSNAMVLVKGSHIMNGVAQMIAHPKQTRAAVAAASPFMAERMDNEVAALTDSMNEILLNPSLYEKSQAWAMRHSYFLQSALDNAMGPMIWTGAYNQALEQKMSEEDAVAFADGVIRKTQGSTLPEDISRMETGPAYARLFTQFTGYFNMMANTNGTALAQIAGEMGLKKGAGKALGVVFFGMLAPIWVAEAIAQAFKGGPGDDDGDGYLDDWLAAVFGVGTIKGMLAQVPFIAQLGQVAVNRFNKNPADDRFSLSPAVSLLESAASVPYDVYKKIVDGENTQRLVRDVAALVSLATGIPAVAAARPLGYVAGTADGKINPTSGADAVRGMVTGVASPESKNR